MSYLVSRVDSVVGRCPCQRENEIGECTENVKPEPRLDDVQPTKCRTNIRVFYAVGYIQPLGYFFSSQGRKQTGASKTLREETRI